MVSTQKKETAHFRDMLECTVSRRASLPKFKITMADGSLPTLEQLQEIQGITAQQAAALLQEMSIHDRA